MPPGPAIEAFVRVVNMPIQKLSAVSTRRSGIALSSLARPLRILHQALENWKGRAEIEDAVKSCASAAASDAIDDPLLRRELAERILRASGAGAVWILDALASEIIGPSIPVFGSLALDSAALIAEYASFLDSWQGRAYAELRLALNVETDFRNRFNIHIHDPPYRYNGVWHHTIIELLNRTENVRVSGRQPERCNNGTPLLNETPPS